MIPLILNRLCRDWRKVIPNNNIIYEGDSDFAQAINGRDQIEILAIIDELMETLRVINPRLYMSVMRRIN